MNIRKSLNEETAESIHSIDISSRSINDILTVATVSGLRTYSIDTGKLNVLRELDVSLSFATNLDGSNVFGLIGGRAGATNGPNKFLVWADDKKGPVFTMEANLAISRVCLTRSRYALVFERGVRVKKLFLNGDARRNVLPDATIGNYQTVQNLRGLCCLGDRRMLCPGMSLGQVRILELSTKKVTIVPAHKTALQAIALSSDEELLATASEQGTLVRVWSASDGAKVCEFRRGLDQAIVLSLAFSPSGQHLAVTSDKSTLHIFDLPRANSQPEPLQKGERVVVPMARSGSTTTKPVNIPPGRSKRSSLGAAAGDSPVYGTSGSHSSSKASKRVSMPSAGIDSTRYNLSSSPDRNNTPPRPTAISPAPFDAQSNLASLSPSDAISHQGLPSSTNGGPAWNDFPASIAALSGTGSTTSSSSSGATSRAQKYGGLATLPFAPRILSDTYSALSIPFSMGDEAPFVPAGVTVAHLLRAGTLQKGRIAWVDDDVIVVVGGGRDARWEKFRMGFDQQGNRGIERVGWKRYMEDDGLD